MSSPSKILPGLWQGGAESLDDLGWFQGAGISHVVSACNVRCAHPHLEVLHVGVKDDDLANIQQHLPRVLRFIHAARAAGGVVYVHCSQGDSRSSALVVAYVMAAAKRPADEALRFLTCRRDVAFPNLGFFHQLFTFWAGGQCAELHDQLQREAAGLFARDAEEVAGVLADTAHADVDVSAFMDCLRSAHAADGRPPNGPAHADGVLLWQDAVIAREDLELIPEGGVAAGAHVVPRGERILVLSRAGLDDAWGGEFQGRRGRFPRRAVRELDCAESEDEDYYQGSMGNDPPCDDE